MLWKNPQKHLKIVNLNYLTHSNDQQNTSTLEFNPRSANYNNTFFSSNSNNAIFEAI